MFCMFLWTDKKKIYIWYFFYLELCLECDLVFYHIYPKYWETLSIYHTCPKIWNNPLYGLLMCWYCFMYGKQCRPWSDAAYCCIWSGSALFANACLSQYLGILQYILFVWCCLIYYYYNLTFLCIICVSLAGLSQILELWFVVCNVRRRSSFIICSIISGEVTTEWVRGIIGWAMSAELA